MRRSHDPSPPPVCLSAGRLSLSLDKDSFEMLGVEGKPSRFNHRTNSRFGLNNDIIMTSSVSHLLRRISFRTADVTQQNKLNTGASDWFRKWV